MAYSFNNTPGGDAALLEQLGFDPRTGFSYPTTTGPSSHQIPVTTSNTMAQQHPSRQSPPVSWPMSFDLSGGVDPMAAAAASHSPTSGSMSPSSSEDSQAQSPGHHSASASSSPLQQQLSPYQTAAFPNAVMIPDWTMQQQQQQLQQQQQQQAAVAAQELQYIQTSGAMVPFNHFAASFPPSPLSYLPTTTATLDASIPIGSTFGPIQQVGDMSQATQMGMDMGFANWQDFGNMNNYQPDGLPRMGSMGSQSPTGTYLEVLSLGSASDHGWATVDVYHQGYDAYSQNATQNAAIFNPSQTLHLRSHSDSSQSDGISHDLGSSFEEVSGLPYSPYSPSSDTHVDPATNHRHCSPAHHHHGHDIISPAAAVAPMPIKTISTSRAGPSNGSGAGASSVSPPTRRGSGPRKSPIAKPKAVIRRSSTGKDKTTGEKKVGRRRGPLLPEQRKQASEIRKLRACLRCKFLKKTCDKGEPCAGCQPSHARLWQVPCTRIDIKDLGYFMKDWKADYDRHMGRGVSVYNVKGFAPKETLMWITHGYGFCLPIMVREVFVADDSCFQVDWVESHLQDQDPIDFGIRTEKLDVGQEGVSVDALHEYLDKHIDQAFDYFIEDHFDGTPFLTEILKTAHRFYVREKTPIIRKALKLVLAYNLTLHITMIEQQGNEVALDGQIDDEDSKYFGKVVAPVMINFQIKCAMADMWRELQKEILEELSALYSSVYSGERLKNWPIIFLLASILLAVWEEIQFDCHYRVLDTSAVNKFCNDMESTPVGVIVGLFHAISQKLPAFTEWDTRRHGQLLNNNEAVCDAMTEVRSHVVKHEAYLRTRNEAKFDRYDFDSLSNKFLSKLVIRAN